MSGQWPTTPCQTGNCSTMAGPSKVGTGPGRKMHIHWTLTSCHCLCQTFRGGSYYRQLRQSRHIFHRYIDGIRPRSSGLLLSLLFPPGRRCTSHFQPTSRCRRDSNSTVSIQCRHISRRCTAHSLRKSWSWHGQALRTRQDSACMCFAESDRCTTRPNNRNRTSGFHPSSHSMCPWHILYMMTGQCKGLSCRPHRIDRLRLRLWNTGCTYRLGTHCRHHPRMWHLRHHSLPGSPGCMLCRWQCQHRGRSGLVDRASSQTPWRSVGSRCLGNLDRRSRTSTSPCRCSTRRHSRSSRLLRCPCRRLCLPFRQHSAHMSFAPPCRSTTHPSSLHTRTGRPGVGTVQRHRRDSPG
jgi:hypothetical protein